MNYYLKQFIATLKISLNNTNTQKIKSAVKMHFVYSI